MHKLMSMFVALLMVTAVGAFAANLSSTSANQLAGSGAVDVVAPTSSPVIVKWTLVNGDVSGAAVVWTPTGTGAASFSSYVAVFSDDACTTKLTDGSVAEPAVTRGVSRNTAVAFSTPVDASQLECVKVVIVQD